MGVWGLVRGVQCFAWGDCVGFVVLGWWGVGVFVSSLLCLWASYWVYGLGLRSVLSLFADGFSMGLGLLFVLFCLFFVFFCQVVYGYGSFWW